MWYPGKNRKREAERIVYDAPVPAAQAAAVTEKQPALAPAEQADLAAEETEAVPVPPAEPAPPQLPDPSAPSFPVTVKAPIILDGTSPEGLQAFVDFVAAIETHSNTEIAKKEAERLQPYFSAVHTYLSHVIDEIDPASEAGQQKEILHYLTKAGSLTALFNAIASHTRNTLVSDVVIMPESIHEGPAAKLFPYSSVFNPSFKYGLDSFSFGFLQVYERNGKSSTTIPTFTLNTEMMEAVAPHQPQELYRQMQLIITGMNHDMLHHYQSPWLNQAIAHNFGGDYRSGPMFKWVASLPGKRVEEWSQLAHGKIFMTPENEELVEETHDAVARYFDELDRIAESLPAEEAHAIVDYFGTVVAQTLSRTFPLNHPLITQCLNRMETADTIDPAGLIQKAIEKFGEMTKQNLSAPDQVRDLVQRNSDLAGIVTGYRQLGCDILPDNDDEISYRGLKLLHLAKLEPDELRTHLPAPVNPVSIKVREDSDAAFLRLINAVIRTTGFPALQG